MPMHDWTRVDAAIFRAFRHYWIAALSDLLNVGRLPAEYYALAEPFIGVVTGEFYRPRISSIAVHRADDDRSTAIVEVVSLESKSSEDALQVWVEKACETLENGIHLLVVDAFPPGPCGPNGIHAAIWERFAGESFRLPSGNPLQFAAYECDERINAYVETIAVGQDLPDMPLFLEPGAYMKAPLQETYQTAFASMPRRWQTVLAPPA